MEFLVGQEKLINNISKYTLNTLPKAMLFVGQRGCGKKTLIKYLAQRLNLDLINIDSKITPELLIEFSQKTIPTLYVIDLSNFNETQQNQFLKFIEEPSDLVHVVVLAENIIEVIPTISNRCIKFIFEKYTKEALTIIAQNIAPDVLKYPQILEIVRTPGILTNINAKQFEGLVQFCLGIINYASTMSYTNFIALATQINYKDFYDKYDFDLFFDVLDYTALQEFIKTNNQNAFKILHVLNEFRILRLNKNLIKENFMLNFLTQIYKELH